MTAQEMHIEIDLELQKINSFINKDFLPQEKDWFLNKEVVKFINQRRSKDSNFKQTGFQDTTKRLEDLKDLIKPAFLPVERNNQGEAFVTLPSDYFVYNRIDAVLLKDCSANKIVKGVRTYYKSIVPLNITSDNIQQYSIIINLPNGSNVTLFSLNDLPAGYINNVDFRKQKFLLIKAIKIILSKRLKELYSTTLSLYWEREGLNFHSESFILKGELPFNYIIQNVNGVNTFYNANTANISVVDNNTNFIKVSTRVIDDEFYTDAVNSGLSKSTANSPITRLERGVIYILEPKGVVLKRLDLSYICEPNLIDLLLNSNLNLPSNVCAEIVSNTVRFLKGIISNPNYEVYARENTLIE